MSGDRQHGLFRHRRLSNWAALVAVFALLTWAVGFAAHLHSQSDAHVPGQHPSVCEMCVAFQAGVTTDVAAHDIPKLAPAFIRTTVVSECPGLPLVLPYRSRAPPDA